MKFLLCWLLPWFVIDSEFNCLHFNFQTLRMQRSILIWNLCTCVKIALGSCLRKYQLFEYIITFVMNKLIFSPSHLYYLLYSLPILELLDCDKFQNHFTCLLFVLFLVSRIILSNFSSYTNWTPTLENVLPIRIPNALGFSKKPLCSFVSLYMYFNQLLVICITWHCLSLIFKFQ